MRIASRDFEVSLNLTFKRVYGLDYRQLDCHHRAQVMNVLDSKKEYFRINA